MEQATKDRLSAVIGRKAELARVAAAKVAADRAVAERREEEKARARERWKTALPELEAAIAEVNREIAAQGLALHLSPHAAKASPAIAWLTIRLSEDGRQTIKEITFNVNAFGGVQLITSSPNSGRKEHNRFTIHEGSQDRFSAMLVECLEQFV